MTALGVGATQPVRAGLVDQPCLYFLPLLLSLAVVLGALLGRSAFLLVAWLAALVAAWTYEPAADLAAAR